jgi:hypothetical protein
MNAFTSAATKAAAPAELEKTTIAGLMSRFLTGGSGTSGEYHTLEGNLYHKKKVVARRTPKNLVLLSESHLPDVEANDLLIGSIFATGNGLRRLKSFDNLTTPADRVTDLDEGRLDDFSGVAALFGFTYSDEEVKALETAKAFRQRVRDFFTKVEEDELNRIRTAEERGRAERVAAAALPWDRGEGATRNSTVQGAGGGQRIRLAKPINRSGRIVQRVETSIGNMTTLRQVQTAWEYATRFWHGGEYYNTSYGASKYIGGSRQIKVHGDRIQFGCQTVTRKEAERFADVMGWPQKKAKRA